MFIFPIIYVVTFFTSLYKTLQNKPQSILLFIVLGLPIYITSLSITYKYGLGSLVPIFQSFKEILILVALTILIKIKKEKLILLPLDKLVLAFLVYCMLYVLIPLGTYGFVERLMAAKSLCFFPLIYFSGRLMDFRKVDMNMYFHYVCILTILAAFVLIFEVATDRHLQISTGYAAFTKHFFGVDPSGNYGLSWTFETANGIKRFASFYGMPLELGTNTLFAVSIIAALFTKDDNKIHADIFTIVAFIMTLLSIFFAFSRASFASYFIILYVYALITKRKIWLKYFYYGVIGMIIIFLFWIEGDVYDIIMSTLDFSDTSSAFHVFQWLDGLEAISSHPLGLGMGMSGRVSLVTESNIGGENQLIIIGVQTGVLAVLLYLLIYIYTIRICLQLIKSSVGKVRKLAIALLLVKVGLIIPLLTANTESYIYIMYITWLCTGLLISIQAMPFEKQIITVNGSAK